MAFKKGDKKLENSGRKEGSINKLTKTVKERVLEAFNELQEDEEANLVTWGKANPGYFYQIAAKLIPTEISAKVEGKIITVVSPNKKQYDSNS